MRHAVRQCSESGHHTAKLPWVVFVAMYLLFQLQAAGITATAAQRPAPDVRTA